MAYGKRNYIADELKRLNGKSDIPVLREIPEDEELSDSLQEELMQRCGIWSYLEIWDFRNHVKKGEGL